MTTLSVDGANVPPLTDAEMASVLKMQAFIRGAICRARVSLMVKDLIDQLLAQRPAMVASAAAATATTKNGGGDDDDSSHHLTGDSEHIVDNNDEGFGHVSVSEIKHSIEARMSPPQSPMKSSSPPKSPLRKGTGAATTSTSGHLPVLQRNATRHVPSSLEVLSQHGERLDAEMQQLLKDIRRIGEPGKPEVTFGELFDDDQVANFYEALVGTLKAAKKKGLIKYDGQVLLKGMSDQVVISIIP
jgi:Costars